MSVFPRHRAAASLKRHRHRRRRRPPRVFPRHRAAASLKPVAAFRAGGAPDAFFRGIGPRPH